MGLVESLVMNHRLIAALLESIIAQAEVMKATMPDYQRAVKLRQTVMELEQELEDRGR